MRHRTLLSLAVATALGLAASPALGHEGHALTDAERHVAADTADVSVKTLERRMRRVTRRLGRQPGTRAPASAAARLTETTDPGQVGSWSPVFAAPVVPVFEALLPSGKILMWDSVADGPTESSPDQSSTRAAVYDPATDTSKRVDVSGFNLFCAGFVQLANGNVFVAGGNADQALNGIRQTHVFDWKTERWSRGPDMQDGRWYPSVASMPNDEALIIGGGPTVAEVRTTSGGLRRPANIVTGSSREYPFFQAAPDGRALVVGPWRGMALVDTFGAGAISGPGYRDAISRSYGGYAPYDIGRTLVAGGGNVDEDGLVGVPSRTATTVDSRSGLTLGAPTGSMTYRRRQHNLTVLADGTVLATGGQSTMGGGGLVDLANAVYAAERWDPATGQWTVLAPAAVVREYHSSALLLPDGRVLTGGGGICGICNQVGYLRRDQEIFTPPYLYRHDGSGQLAPRPELTGVPSAVAYDGTFSLSSPQAADIRKLALVRLGAPTHGQDQSQRYVPLSFTASGTTLTATGPNNPNEAPAGHYMLFAVNSAGVPSVSRIVTLARAAAPASSNLALNRTTAGSTPCSSTESGSKAVNGSLTDKWCSKPSDRWLRVDLGTNRTIGKVVLRHAGAGGESTALNTRNFRIETRTSAGSTFTTAASVSGNTASVTTTTFSARSARYVRLRVTAGEQVNAAGPARIYELEVYATDAVVPDGSGAPVTAYSGLGASGRTQRFEAGAYEAGRGNLNLVGADAIRSVTVMNGYRATLCREAGLVGCTTLGPGAYASLPSGFDLAVSSLRVARTP